MIQASRAQEALILSASYSFSKTTKEWEYLSQKLRQVL